MGGGEQIKSVKNNAGSKELQEVFEKIQREVEKDRAPVQKKAESIKNVPSLEAADFKKMGKAMKACAPRYKSGCLYREFDKAGLLEKLKPAKVGKN